MSEAAVAKAPDTEDDVVVNDADFNAGFDAGTGDAPPAANGNAGQQDNPGTETEQAAETPEYVQLTRKDFDRLIASAEETERLKAQMPKVFGTMGNLQQVLQSVQAKTAAGGAITISDEDFAELREDFPELEAHTRKGLERLFQKMGARGTGEASAIDPEAVSRAVREARLKDELEALEEVHPGWNDIVGKPDDAENPFRRWLAEQPEDYQNRVNTTQSAAVVARAIDRFKAASTATRRPPATSQGVDRRERIQAAVQPRGSGPAPASKPRSEEDDFNEGFRTG